MYAEPIFCTQCGQPLERRLVEASGRPVPVCTACGAIHWIDPKIAAGCVILEGDRVLLVSREGRDS